MKVPRTIDEVRQSVTEEFRGAEEEYGKGSGLGALAGLRASTEALLKLILLERGEEYKTQARLEELKGELLKILDSTESLFVGLESVQRATNYVLHHNDPSVTAAEKSKTAGSFYRSGREQFQTMLDWYQKEFGHDLWPRAATRGPVQDASVGQNGWGEWLREPGIIDIGRKVLVEVANEATKVVEAERCRRRRRRWIFGIAAGLSAAAIVAAVVTFGGTARSTAENDCRRTVDEWVAAHNRHDESAYLQHLVFPLRWFNRWLSQEDFVERRQRRDPNGERLVETGQFQALRTCDGRILFDWLEIVHKQGKRYDQRKYLLFEKTLDSWKIVGISEPDNHKSLVDICPPPGA